MKHKIILLLVAILSINTLSYGCGGGWYDPLDSCRTSETSGLSDSVKPANHLVFQLLDDRKTRGAGYYNYWPKEMSLQTYKEEVNKLFTEVEKPDLSQAVYDYKYGSCYTNTYETSLLFIKEMMVDPVVTAGHRTLAEIRHDMLNICSYLARRGKVNVSSIMGRVTALKGSPGVSNYPDYLEATAFFYQENYLKAYDLFSEITSSNSSWVAETSQYLLGRISLLLAQTLRADNGDYDKEWANKAELNFNNYISQYPSGRYFDSATNFNRRIYLYRQDYAALNRELKKLFIEGYESSGEESAAKLAEVFEHYKDSGQTDYSNPHFAVLSMSRREKASIEELERLKEHISLYKEHPIILQYLETSILYKAGDYNKLVNYRLLKKNKKSNKKKRPDQIFFTSSELRELKESRRPGKLSNLEVVPRLYKLHAIKMLKPEEDYIRALRQTFDDANKRGNVHLSMYAEYKIAQHYLDKGDLSYLVPNNVVGGRLRREILYYLADDNFLKALLSNRSYGFETRQVARDILLDRYLLDKQYKDFLLVYDLLDDKGEYEKVATAIKMLAKDEKDPKGLLNYGYYLYSEQLLPQTHCNEAELVRPYIDEYRKDAIDFGKAEPPFLIYKQALESLDRNKRDDLEAKILHHMIYSFKLGSEGYYNTWGKVPESENKGEEWFRYLHKKYPRSRWAKLTKYYY